MPGYGLLCSPAVNPGQTVVASMSQDESSSGPVTVGLYVRIYGENDALTIVRGPAAEIAPGSDRAFRWKLPTFGGAPVATL